MDNNKDYSDIVEVMADFVLVRQTMRKKSGKIITDAAAKDNDKFDFSFEVVQKGPDCKRTFKVGDFPIFSQYVQFSGLKAIDKTDKNMINLVIVHENDIIAVDRESKPLQLS